MTDNSSKKKLIVVGGPNGSGKTTLAREILDEQDVTYISADDIAHELNPANPESVRIQAGKEFFNRLNWAVQNGKNVLIESTLSGKTLSSILNKYKEEYDYSVIVIFVYVSNDEICAERVAIRAKKGGHDVPPEDIRRRFDRSLTNFWHTYRHQSDQWYLYCNSEDDFQEVARYVSNDEIVLDESLFVIFKQIIKENE